jgi:hypothetical protein
MRITALATLALLALWPGAALATAIPGPVPRPGMLPDSTAIATAPARQDDQRGVAVRVWTEDQRDAFSSGDRTRVFVRTSTGAYVAVLHIDTSGNLEVLFPSSPYEDGYLAAGRLYSLPGGASRSWTVRGAPGVGYLFAVASDQPLEFRSIRALFGARQAGYGGDHVIYGDPFAAMERFARLMVPDWGYVDHAMDWYSYQLGGRYAYPRYACYDSYGSWYYGRGSQYDSCDRVRLALRDDPSYYDARYHRADRRAYVDARTRYGYKEDPRVPSGGEGVTGRPALRPERTTEAPRRETVRRPADERRTNDAEPRQRPTLQRREGGGETRKPDPPRPEPARPETRRPEPPPRDPSHESTRGVRPSGFDTWSRGSFDARPRVDAGSGRAPTFDRSSTSSSTSSGGGGHIRPDHD